MIDCVDFKDKINVVTKIHILTVVIGVVKLDEIQ